MVILCSTRVNRVYIHLLVCCRRRYPLASVAQDIHSEIEAWKPVNTRVLAKHIPDRGCPAVRRRNCQANTFNIRSSICNATEARRLYCATVSNDGSAARERTPLVRERPLKESEVEGLASAGAKLVRLLQGRRPETSPIGRQVPRDAAYQRPTAAPCR